MRTSSHDSPSRQTSVPRNAERCPRCRGPSFRLNRQRSCSGIVVRFMAAPITVSLLSRARTDRRTAPVSRVSTCRSCTSTRRRSDPSLIPFPRQAPRSPGVFQASVTSCTTLHRKPGDTALASKWGKQRGLLTARSTFAAYVVPLPYALTRNWYLACSTRVRSPCVTSWSTSRCRSSSRTEYQGTPVFHAVPARIGLLALSSLVADARLCRGADPRRVPRRGTARE